MYTYIYIYIYVIIFSSARNLLQIEVLRSASTATTSIIATSTATTIDASSINDNVIISIVMLHIAHYELIHDIASAKMAPFRAKLYYCLNHVKHCESAVSFQNFKFVFAA